MTSADRPEAAPPGPDQIPLYNTAAVVQRTGVPAATFRAWERRYDFPKPHREPTGQRLYTERDIATIRWLQGQTDQGVAVSRAVDMLRRGYARVGPAAAAEEPRSFAALGQELLAALLAFDTARAEGLLAEAFGLFTVEDVCLEVLEPAMVEVGNHWHRGTLSIAEEHFATSFLRTRLLSMLNSYSISYDTRADLVLTACAPAEWHELGVLMVSLFLARHGFRVRYLGANLPLEELREPVARLRPAVVIVSAHALEAAQRLPAVREVLAQLPQPRPAFAYGGRAFNEQPSLREPMPGVYLGGDARQALQTVRELLAATAP